jgi:leader peptidase (prepilin peptidase)/N-methyltransferase
MGVIGAAGVATVLIWAAALSVSDLRWRRLPNVLTVPGAAVIVAVAAVCGRGLPALIGGCVLAGLYLVIHLIDPGALGGGDVKLALGLGALTAALSSDVWVLGALGAPLLTAAAAVVSLLRGGTGTVPHGPSMCTASLIAAALAVL